MSFDLVLHFPKLIAMDAYFFMCEHKVSNLIYSVLVTLVLFYFYYHPKQTKNAKKATRNKIT